MSVLIRLYELRWEVGMRAVSDPLCFPVPAVEDKVKDQLEAANPEPIIEEVVSGITPAKVRAFRVLKLQRTRSLG